MQELGRQQQALNSRCNVLKPSPESQYPQTYFWDIFRWVVTVIGAFRRFIYLIEAS